MRSPDSKIMSLDEVASAREAWRKRGGRVVLTNGCYDLLHRGHAEYLYRARRLGTALIVAVNTDESIRAIKGPARPLIGEADRLYMVASLACVDAVTPFGTAAEHTACGLIERLRPDIYAKGGDYTPATLVPSEQRLLVSLGIRLELLPPVSGFSTTDLIRRAREIGG